jgi:hypothetical protein
MGKTMELLNRALEMQPSAEQWCKELKLSRSALAVAKHRGRLAPGVAGAIAIKLGENPIQWIATAAMEAEPESPIKDRLLKQLTSLYKKLSRCRVFPTAPILCAVY